MRKLTGKVAPYYENEAGGITIYCGDALSVLRDLPDESVNCCVTSPPYFGLRDYGTAAWEGGSEDCDHRRFSYESDKETPGGRGGSMPRSEDPFRDECGKCGAIRIDSQIGLEPTPQLYVEKMVEVFAEVRRVLTDDGTLWLNLGDSYYGSSMTGGNNSINAQGGADGFKMARQFRKDTRDTVGALKTKDMMGIPWRVAFALQADGWWLRQDIIWAKPNPMPESVTDRCTKSHEYIFLLSKSDRYHYDAEAIREPGTRYAWNAPQFKCGDITRHHGNANGGGGSPLDEEAGINKRSVWTVATQPFSGAHFAVFPQALIKPCIRAGVPAGGVCLDPFFGSGTTGIVCQEQGVRCIGIELNQAYAQMAANRLAQGVLDFGGAK